MNVSGYNEIIIFSLKARCIINSTVVEDNLKNIRKSCLTYRVLVKAQIHGLTFKTKLSLSEQTENLKILMILDSVIYKLWKVIGLVRLGYKKITYIH